METTQETPVQAVKKPRKPRTPKPVELIMPEKKAEAAPRDYKSLFEKIEALTGLDKKKFCSGLTLEEKKAYVSHLNDKNSEKVTGVFRCYEPMGGSVKMTCMAFGDEQPVTYTFLDGGEYTIPKYIAKRFENEFQGVGTWYPTHSHIMDSQGVPVVSVGKKNRRFGFSSLDFQ